MREKLIPSAWLDKEGRRLDCGPYLSGAVEAKLLLERLPVRKDPLHTLTRGHNGGIYNGPQFVRRYVATTEYGVPFLTSSSMLIADLGQVDLLRKKDAFSSRLSYLRIEEGMTLISCSGTIGNMVYARPELAGVWSSQDVLKVAPDPEKVLPGFVYAFLSGPFGIPLVVGGTYGAIIQHIEPEHVWNLPIPRLGVAIEKECHGLIKLAGDERSRASDLLRAALAETHSAWGVSGHASLRPSTTPDVVSVPASKLNGRLDGFYHSTGARNADRLVSEVATRVPVRALGDCVERVFETPRFSRIPVMDVAYGAAFMSISDLARIDPVSDDFISKRQVVATVASVGSGWLILPRVGQLQGLFGHAVCIPPHLDGIAVSDNNIRIVPRSPEDSGYLFASLSSELCYWQIIRRACGTSIPYLDSARVKQVPIPWPADSGVRNSIAAKVNEAMDLRSRAVRCEREAVAIVEKAIRKGTV